MKPTLRTFVAVEIDEAVRRAAAEMVDELRSAAADVTWVAPHNMHLTVKFLGDVAAEKIPQVCHSVAQAVAEVQPFALQLCGVGAFPNAARPRTVWLGTEAGRQELAVVAERIEEALKKLGFAREGRAFRGHLTLGRVRRPSPALAALANLLKQHAEFEAGIAAIDGVAVFSSQLGPKVRPTKPSAEPSSPADEPYASATSRLFFGFVRFSLCSGSRIDRSSPSRGVADQPIRPFRARPTDAQRHFQGKILLHPILDRLQEDRLFQSDDARKGERDGWKRKVTAVEQPFPSLVIGQQTLKIAHPSGAAQTAVSPHRLLYLRTIARNPGNMSGRSFCHPVPQWQATTVQPESNASSSFRGSASPMLTTGALCS